MSTTRPALPRHNFTVGVLSYLRPDVFVLSVGKSGRTWFRVLLNKYLSLVYDVPFSVDDLAREDGRIPSILYDHEAWSHIHERSRLRRWLGSSIVPTWLLRRKKVIVVVRDPRDTVVSGYFQATKRSRRQKTLEMDEWIRMPTRGVGAIVAVMNEWRDRLRGHPACLWVRYEDMKADTVAEMRRVAVHLGVPIDEARLQEAGDFAHFENMRKMEASGNFNSRILQPRDTSDPDSFKVRRGKVGGYRDYLDAQACAYVDEQMRALDPDFGYGAEAGGG